MDWKNVVHYAAAAGLFLLGVLASTGIHIPGVTLDAVTLYASAAALMAPELKKIGA